jgi:hypothetical protein
MFDHVLIRRAVGGSTISAGQIAEALFYYQRVQLFLDTGTVLNLLKQIGVENFLNLLDRKNVSAVYCEEILGTHTESVGVSQVHQFVAFSFAGSNDVGQLKTTPERLQYQVEKNGFSKKITDNFVSRFLRKVPVKKINGNHFIDGGVTVAAQRDLMDAQYVRRAVRIAVLQAEDGYDLGDKFSFDVLNSDLGNFVFTDIDFETVNNRRIQRAAPIADKITPAHLLSSILDARADMALAAHYGGDFITSRVTSSIIQVKYAEMLRRTNLNAVAQREFIEIQLPDAPCIAEIVDSGERDFKEFLTLLDRASRFKEWMASVNPDEGLIRTYIKDISKNSIVDRMPAKVLRYILTTGIGDFGLTAAAAIGFVDSFLVQKFLGGWRPNHFVHSNYIPFIRK